MKISAVHCCIAAASLLLSTASHAQHPLSGDEIKKRLSGNTLESAVLVRNEAGTVRAAWQRVTPGKLF